MAQSEKSFRVIFFLFIPVQLQLRKFNQFFFICLIHLFKITQHLFLLYAEGTKPCLVLGAFDVGEILGGKDLVFGWVRKIIKQVRIRMFIPGNQVIDPDLV